MIKLSDPLVLCFGYLSTQFLFVLMFLFDNLTFMMHHVRYILQQMRVMIVDGYMDVGGARRLLKSPPSTSRIDFSPSTSQPAEKVAFRRVMGVSL